MYDLNDNLFEPLLPKVRRAFEQGDGGELRVGDRTAGNMHALHSSSAIACNLFHYWRRTGHLDLLARALKLPSPGIDSFEFEAQHEIDPSFARAPNLDGEIIYRPGGLRASAIECKFAEPYSARGHSGLSAKYLASAAYWRGYRNLRRLAGNISPHDNRFQYLHAAQLIKHLLGLTACYGVGGFRLLYLWYEAPGPESTVHRDEIRDFAKVAKADGVAFQSGTYQDVITRLAKERSLHQAYVDYLTERYL